MAKSRAVIIASMFAGGAIILVSAYFLLFAPANFRGSQTRFDVTRGKALGGIATDLKDEGLVRSPLGMRLAWWASGVRTIRAGSYTLSPQMDAWEIARVMKSDINSELAITVPEGYRVEQIAKLLVDKGVIDSNQAFVAAGGGEFSGMLEFLSGRASLEGYLFPDTYNFYPDTDPETVIATMTSNFVSRLTPLTDQVSASGKTLDQIITLASLIEKEAKTDEDRKLIAGVLENRLSKNMRLDVDASTRYAVGNFEDPLTQVQLDSNSPYNTRKVGGLPPGPICNPGLAAIKAVLSPTSSDYLYYLTGRDGKTYYAKTLDEHNQNKANHL